MANPIISVWRQVAGIVRRRFSPIKATLDRHPHVKEGLGYGLVAAGSYATCDMIRLFHDAGSILMFAGELARHPTFKNWIEFGLTVDEPVGVGVVAYRALRRWRVRAPDDSVVIKTRSASRLPFLGGIPRGKRPVRWFSQRAFARQPQ